MGIEQSANIDIGHAVAVGEEKVAVVGAQILGGSGDASSGSGIESGIGEGYLPTGFGECAVL